MRKARIAVIGLNFGKKHASYIAENDIPGELVAVSDLDESYASYAEGWSTVFFTDYKKMLEEVKPDGVIIAVPPKLHSIFAIECMKQGADVLVEKPISLTSEEADQMIKAADQYRRQILVGQHHRFDPSVCRAKRRIDSGELGKLIGFHIYGTLPKPDWYYAQDYKKKRAAGGGTVANNGIHDADRIRYLFGDVESVFAMKGNSLRGFEVEDTAAVAVRCKNGVVGTYYISDGSHPLSEYTDCYFGEKGSIRLMSSSFYAQKSFHTYQEGYLGEGFDLWQREGRIVTERIPLQDNHGKEVEHFCDMIINGVKPVTSAEEGKKSMELMNAIIESMDTGRVIRL